MKFRRHLSVILVTIFLRLYEFSAMSGSEFDVIDKGESMFHFSTFSGARKGFPF